MNRASFCCYFDPRLTRKGKTMWNTACKRPENSANKRGINYFGGTDFKNIFRKQKQTEKTFPISSQYHNMALHYTPPFPILPRRPKSHHHQHFLGYSKVVRNKWCKQNEASTTTVWRSILRKRAERNYRIDRDIAPGLGQICIISPIPGDQHHHRPFLRIAPSFRKTSSWLLYCSSWPATWSRLTISACHCCCFGLSVRVHLHYSLVATWHALLQICAPSARALASVMFLWLLLCLRTFSPPSRSCASPAAGPSLLSYY